MKIKNSLLLGAGVLTLGISASVVQPQSSNAMSIYSSSNPFWNKLPWVTLGHNVKIIKIKNHVPEYKSYPVGTYTAKKGYHYRLGHWGSSYSWTLESGRFNSHSNSYYSTSRYTYVVAEKWNNHSWFRFGIN